MARTDKAKQKQRDLLAKVPAAATRIKVVDEFKNECWRELADVAITDVIQTNKAGAPVVMRGKPGRKKSKTNVPVNDAAKELLDRKKDSFSKDTLLQVALSDSNSTDLLHQVIIGLGEETASLLFERHEAERKGKDTSQVSVRRINGLKAVAETWLKRKDQLGAKSLDLTSPAYMAAVQFILETMQEAMATLDVERELSQTIFAKFSQLTKKDSWEPELKARIKSAH